MADYIPESDADFGAWAQAFFAYLSGHTADLGLVVGDITGLGTTLGTWNSAYPAHKTAQGTAQSAREAKDQARKALEAQLRAMVGRLQSSSAVSEAEKEALGITVRDHEPTPVGPPMTRPVPQVDTSQRMRHLISWSNEGEPPTELKPAGVHGCEIWMKIGDPPATDGSDMSYLCTDTRTPYLLVFSAGDEGKTAHYMLRWVNRRGEPGPWSTTESATIGG